MTLAADFERLTPALALWHAYDPASKTERFSTAVCGPQGTLIVDPIPLAAPAHADLLSAGRMAGIAVTNSNHWRSAVDFAEASGAPIFAHSVLSEEAPHSFTSVAQGDRILDTIEVIPITGAAPGEIALHVPDDGGTLIMGDALIHFDPYGFTFLPSKYCTNFKRMRESLRDLLNYPVQRLLFAHGTPILSKAGDRLRQLLE